MIPDFVSRRGRPLAGAPEQLERPLVAPAVPRDLVEPRHGLGVVVEDVRRRHRSPSASAPAWPWKSGISSSTRHPGASRRTARTVAAKWAAPPSARSSRFTDVITTCSRPSSATARPTRTGSSRSSQAGRPCANGAVAAVPRADVAQDHEGGGEIFPALADVRAVRLLADGVEIPLPHQALQAQVLRPTRRAHLEPRRLGRVGRAQRLEERQGYTHHVCP